MARALRAWAIKEGKLAVRTSHSANKRYVYLLARFGQTLDVRLGRDLSCPTSFKPVWKTNSYFGVGLFKLS